MYKVWTSPLKATIVKSREEAETLQMMVCAATGQCAIIEKVSEPNEKTINRPRGIDTDDTGAR